MEFALNDDISPGMCPKCAANLTEIGNLTSFRFFLEFVLLERPQIGRLFAVIFSGLLSRFNKDVRLLDLIGQHCAPLQQALMISLFAVILCRLQHGHSN